MVDLSRHEAAFADANRIEHAARDKQLVPRRRARALDDPEMLVDQPPCPQLHPSGVRRVVLDGRGRSRGLSSDRVEVQRLRDIHDGPEETQLRQQDAIGVQVVAHQLRLSQSAGAQQAEHLMRVAAERPQQTAQPLMRIR